MKKIKIGLISLIMIIALVGCQQKERFNMGSISIIQPKAFTMSEYSISPGSNKSKTLYTSGSINNTPRCEIMVNDNISFGEDPIDEKAAKEFIATYITEETLNGVERQPFPLNEIKVGKNIQAYSQAWTISKPDGELLENRYVVFNTPTSSISIILVTNSNGLVDPDFYHSFDSLLDSIKINN